MFVNQPCKPEIEIEDETLCLFPTI